MSEDEAREIWTQLYPWQRVRYTSGLSNYLHVNEWHSLSGAEKALMCDAIGNRTMNESEIGKPLEEI